MANMKQTFLLTMAITAAMAFTACDDDFLTSTNAGASRTVDDPADTEALLSFAAAAYQPLLLDNFAPVRSNPGDGRAHSIVVTADLRSDDVYRGGSSASDVLELWRLFTFTSDPAYTLNGLWNVGYIGLGRCNQLIRACANTTTGVATDEQKRFNAEAHFLRAWYTHLLWKYWGSVPYFAEALAEPFVAHQYTAGEVYEFIMADLQVACDPEALPMKSEAGSEARASLAAALMLKARMTLYQNDATRYPEITNDMATIIKSGEYSLMPDFKAIWRDDGEFCAESIFEANHLPMGKDWGAGRAYGGFGTLLPFMISPKAKGAFTAAFPDYETRQVGEAWAFAPVRDTVYKLYETGDQRRDGSINFWSDGLYTPQFQNTGYFLAKYAPYAHDVPGARPLNSPNNLRIFRYAETLLNYAELVTLHGQAEAQGVTAQQAFDEIRHRAFSGGNPPAQPLTTESIKLERRREFLGEGMRFWDLVRWGDAPTVLSETVNIAGTDISYERTFTEAKKYLPIPQSEVDKARGTAHELTQNGGWGY
jgi:hypothetical protein